MKKLRNIKVFSFVLGLIIIWYGMDYILERPGDSQWDQSGLLYVYENKDYYDAIIVGTSTTITNVSIEQLYLDYGIAAVTIGEPSQATYLSYYSLEEALKFQSPEVVVFDVKSLFYTEEGLRQSILLEGEHHHIHFSLDTMKNGRTKYLAFCQAKEIVPELNFWDYFCKIYYNHTNWQDLGIGNFDRTSNRMIMNGNLMLLSVLGDSIGDSYLLGHENSGQEQEIPDINLKYLLKMIELCDDKDIPLLLVRGGGYFSWEEYNAVKKIAEEYSIPYFDLTDCEEEYDIKLSEDSIDGNHFNVSGAAKWTSALGDYLRSNYTFSDRRHDVKYDGYKEKSGFYNNVLKAMDDILMLAEALNFDDYLTALRNMDYSDTTVLIAVKDEASANLTYNEIWQLNEIGLSAELKDKFRYSYIGITGESGIQEKLGEAQLSAEGKINENITYVVSSGGLDFGNQASIIINGTEVAQNGRGINIVVYNSTIDQVISSVYFDTYQYENPPTSRIATVNQEQYEVGPNWWLPLEDFQIGETQ